LELEFKKNKANSAKSLNNEYEKKIVLYLQKIKKYDEEKAEISKEAKKMETIRDDAQKHAGIFGLAVIFLQIAILLSSIAALMKRKSIWIIGLAAGAAGLVYFANGFFLFF
jgi:1,4-dihydroxy-2-naphthoate octaprenyltransferase